VQIRGAVTAGSDAAAAALMPTLVALLTAPATRKRVATRAVIGDIGGCVRALWAAAEPPGAALAGDMASAGELLQAALETLVQPQDLLLECAKMFVELLLPALCEVR
jgi:hypothetical protein